MKYFEALRNDVKTACTQHFLQSKYFVRAWERTEWVDREEICDNTCCAIKYQVVKK